MAKPMKGRSYNVGKSPGKKHENAGYQLRNVKTGSRAGRGKPAGGKHGK